MNLFLDLTGITRDEKLEIKVTTRTSILLKFPCLKCDLSDRDIVASVQTTSKRSQPVTPFITKFFIVGGCQLLRSWKLQRNLEHFTLFKFH